MYPRAKDFEQLVSLVIGIALHGYDMKATFPNNLWFSSGCGPLRRYQPVVSLLLDLLGLLDLPDQRASLPATFQVVRGTGSAADIARMALPV